MSRNKPFLASQVAEPTHVVPPRDAAMEASVEPPRPPTFGKGLGRVVACSEDDSAAMTENELVIGRSEFCSLLVSHPSVSRLHATLRRRGDAIELWDLGSTNGTFVNGVRIAAPVRVVPGDLIRVGEAVVTLEESVAPGQSRTLIVGAPGDARTRPRRASAEVSGRR